MGAVFCNNCGHRNPNEANFCSSCGAPLGSGGPNETTVTLAPVDGTDSGEEELAVPIGDLPPGTGTLVVKRGPNAGSRFVLSADVTRVGRHPDSDIFLDDITVSRRHAEIVKRDGKYWVQDVGSLNGTYLNRERVDVAQLASGDEVQVGRFKLVYLAGAGD